MRKIKYPTAETPPSNNRIPPRLYISGEKSVWDQNSVKRAGQQLKEIVRKTKPRYTNFQQREAEFIANNPDVLLPKQRDLSPEDATKIEEITNVSYAENELITYEAEIDETLPPLLITKKDFEETTDLVGQFEASTKYKAIQSKVRQFVRETKKEFKGDLKDYLQIGQSLLQKFCIEAIMGPIHNPDPEKLQIFIDRLSKTNPDLVVKLLDKLITPAKEEENKTQSGRIFAPIIFNGGLHPQAPNPMIIDSQ